MEAARLLAAGGQVFAFANRTMPDDDRSRA